MSSLRTLVSVGLAACALLLAPVTTASAHVHRITPLNCTPAPANAGANQTNETPAAAANGGPISGVIPLTMGGNVPDHGDHFDQGVCGH